MVSISDKEAKKMYEDLGMICHELLKKEYFDFEEYNEQINKIVTKYGLDSWNECIYFKGYNFLERKKYLIATIELVNDGQDWEYYGIKLEPYIESAIRKATGRKVLRFDDKY